MKFVVLTTHRSGSSYFMRCLNSHPDIEARQEDLRRQEDRNKEFLTKLYKGNKNFGFKCMYSHLNDEVLEFFKENDIKIIQLIRRDILETALWHQDNFDPNMIDGGLGIAIKLISDRLKVRIDKVIQKLVEINKDINKYRSIADFTVYYEDDLTGGNNTTHFYNHDTQKRLLDFIGVSNMTLRDSETNQQKDVRPPSSELISNYGALVRKIDNYGDFLKTYYE